MMTKNDDDPTKKKVAALFQEDEPDEDAVATAAAFRDKVRALLERFDVDGDGYLKLEELAALQQATTAGDDDDNDGLTEEMYMMVCRTLDCTPHKGISLDALRLTYVSDGADLDKDYEAVFGSDKLKKQKKKQPVKKSTDEEVYEVGADGTIDISSS